MRVCLLFSVLSYLIGSGLLPQQGNHAQGCETSQCHDRSPTEKGTITARQWQARIRRHRADPEALHDHGGFWRPCSFLWTWVNYCYFFPFQCWFLLCIATVHKESRRRTLTVIACFILVIVFPRVSETTDGGFCFASQ